MDFSLFDATVGASIGAVVFWLVYTTRLGSFRQHALSIVRQAEQEAEQKKAALELELKGLKATHEHQLQQDRFRLETQERSLKNELHQLNKNIEQIKNEQTRIAALQKEIENKERETNAARQAALIALEQNARLSYEEARSAIIQKAKDESFREIEQQKDNWQRCFETECRERAESLLLCAVERKKQTITKERTLTEIPLKDRSFIPRCIGKEGRNIQTLEEMLQVCVLIEENPPRLLLSSHDGKARAVAKMTIERLIDEEKVTPVTIRAAYEKSLSSLLQCVEEQGREAIRNCRYFKAIPQDVAIALGQLSFRSSSGQNVLKHSVEVADLMEILAAELGLKSEKAKAMGLFHHIGKALSTEWGQSHALAGKAFLEKWGMESDIANAVASHHGEIPPFTSEARLLPICDRLSAQLPGVRHLQEPGFITLVQQCEERTRDLPSVLSAWAHYGSNHIELVIRHAPMATKSSLLQSVREALQQSNIPLPVNITLLEAPKQ